MYFILINHVLVTEEACTFKSDVILYLLQYILFVLLFQLAFCVFFFESSVVLPADFLFVLLPYPPYNFFGIYIFIVVQVSKIVLL